MTALEEKVKEQDHLLFGNLHDVGLIPMTISNYEAINGKNGSGGLRSEVKSLAETVLTTRAWISGAAFMGSAIGGVIVWLLEHFIIKHN